MSSKNWRARKGSLITQKLTDFVAAPFRVRINIRRETKAPMRLRLTDIVAATF